MERIERIRAVEREYRVAAVAEEVPLRLAKKYLSQFFGFLPPDW